MITDYATHSKEELITELVSTKTELIQFKAELAQLKKLIFGSKSERFVPTVNPQQTLLDLDIPSDKSGYEQKQKSIAYIRRQSRNNNTISVGRMALPADLPRVDIIIEPKEDVSGLKKIGEEITEELELEPARFF